MMITVFDRTVQIISYRTSATQASQRGAPIIIIRHRRAVAAAFAATTMARARGEYDDNDVMMMCELRCDAAADAAVNATNAADDNADDADAAGIPRMG